ncbi:TonB-dependent receptor [Rapidithrix thailandica]|uniref:TonB-dependent receptor n=1 Tax=Rapidithrix thailandica TaxID=413964 RepID=A0AAW9RYV7_9BACT
MKMFLLRQIIAMTKLMFYGIFVQALCCSLLVAKPGNAQKVSLEDVYLSINEHNAKVERLFALIETQTDFDFAYNKSLLRKEEKLSVHLSNKSLAEVLRYISYRTQLGFKRVDETIHVTRKPSQRAENSAEDDLLVMDDIRVKGTVTDDQGEPLPGVNVLVKGTTQGTITDINGAYTLNAPEQGTLVYSYIGYQSQEIAVDGRTQINITLMVDLEELEEVVVMGYSSKKQSQLTSSVVTVSSEELKGVTTPSLPNMLQGKTAGVFITNPSGEPGETSDIRVRGTGSISAGASPLYVVDGVIGGTFDPRDVESVTVLKDAGATGLYGARAANGVVVVTTKSGKAGKTVLSYNGAVGINTASMGEFEVMNGQELYDYQKTFVDDSELPTDLTDKNTDWVDLAFRTGITHDHQVTASGGNEKNKFYISGGYYQEEGTLISTDYERFSSRINYTHQASDKFSVTARLNGQYWNRTYNPTGALGQAYLNMPWDSPYDADGNPIQVEDEVDWYGRDRSNFLYPLQYNNSTAKGQSFTGDLKLTYNIASWLSFSTSNRADLDFSRNESFNDKRTKSAMADGGRLYNQYYYSQAFLSSNLLTLSKSSGKHQFDGIFGVEFQTNHWDNASVTGKGILAGLDALNSTAEPKNIGGNKGESNFNSYFFQGDYNYDNRYFLTVSFRRDGSSRFGPEQRYGNFYSIGGSWILSNEDFISNIDFISNLKLRASYGVSGNANIGDYAWKGLYKADVQYNGDAAAYPRQPENRELTWESPETYNVGVEIGFWDRIRLNLDYYNRHNKDLLLDVPLAPATGYYWLTKNVGTVRNRGIDIEVETQNLKGGSFTWTTNFNINFNRNKVMKLNEGEDVLRGKQRLIEGEDMYSWYIRKWVGVDPDNGDPLWEKLIYDEEGNVTGSETTNDYSEATQQNVGNASPDFYGGMINTFSYKGLSLSVFFNFLSGNKVYHSARELFDNDGAYYTFNSMKLADGWNRWEQPGDNATHPKPVISGNKQSNKPSSRYLEDGSYIRLRNVRLSYQLPEALISKLKLGNVTVYASGDNLLTFTKFSGMDPEVGLGGRSGGPQEAGVSGTKYPISKKVVFGVNVQF